MNTTKKILLVPADLFTQCLVAYNQTQKMLKDLKEYVK